MMLERAPYGDIAPYASKAKKEGVSVSDTRQTSWFWGHSPAGRIGFCALLCAPKGFVRVKGVYVFPAHRGQGFGTAMTEELIRYAQDDQLASRLEAIAWNPAWYEARGWHKVKKRTNGAYTVRKIT